MSNKIGVAIIGSGAVAKIHADCFKSHSDVCSIKAVCDIFPEKAGKLISEKGLDEASVYEDYREMLKRSDISIVSVCLPPSEHCKVSADAMDMGKHVLCEKPMACSLEEADKMIEASRRNHVLLSVVAQNRYKVPVMKVKRIIDSGAIGRVLSATINSLWWRGQNYYDLWWRGTWANESGGCTSSHATHHIDMMLWMLGKPKSVTAVIKNVGHDNSECEDLSLSVFDYGKSVVLFNASIVSHEEEQEITFQGEKASISIPWKVKASKALSNGFPETDCDMKESIEALYKQLPEISEEGHSAQISNFINAVLGKENLFITGEDGRNTVEMIMGIYKSAFEKRTIDFPIRADDAFYRKESFTSIMPHFNEKIRSVNNLADAGITFGRDMGK